MTDAPNVLTVDDDPQVASMYASFLEPEYAVETAIGGEAALESIDEDVDVVLLDRRMPDLSGDEVLEEIRSRGYDCPVIMVTAINPDFDIVTLSFNDYLVKPVDRADLTEAIERALALSRRDIQIQEYFALVAKRRTLEDEKTRMALEEHDAYAELERRIADLRERMDPPLDEFEEELAEQLSAGDGVDGAGGTGRSVDALF